MASSATVSGSQTPSEARSVIKQHLDTVQSSTFRDLCGKYKSQLPVLNQYAETMVNHGKRINELGNEINAHNESIKAKMKDGKKEMAKSELRIRKMKENSVASLKGQASIMLQQGKALVKTHVLNDLASNHASPVVREQASKVKSMVASKQKAGRKHRKSKKHRKYKKRTTVSNKVKYGVKKNRVVKLYGHRVTKRIGRHHYYTLWKTTRKNLPGKTYHGKFFNSKKAAINHTMKRKGKSKSKVRRNKTKRRH